jgi:phytoene/squalene synthetase
MDAISLYNQTTLECSKLITERYSTSFTLGIKTLAKEFHLPVYAIYGFVRYADEIVDTFHDYDKKALLDKFKLDTFQAIKDGISLNPVLHAYQHTVNKYGIDNSLTEAFFHSMEMDLNKTIHDEASYNEYIYGSAEVVGLMCLRVFTEGDKTLYENTQLHARALGAAFQKVNFLRDIQSDFAERGRVYFPDVDFTVFTPAIKSQIEADIQKDFDNALIGIKMLPNSSKRGVYLAYRFYLKLFKRIKNTEAKKIQTARIRVPDYQKAGLMLHAMMGL